MLSRKKIIFYTCGDQKKQANAAYLIGSYAVSGAPTRVLHGACESIHGRLMHEVFADRALVFKRSCIST